MEEEFELTEGDYVTEDYIHFYQYGKLVLTIPMVDEFSPDDWTSHIKQHMEENNFYPNVWWVSDHGNANLLSL